ncbi:tetratricopeptide repeat protein [Chloroflexi bacterium TSY]|nr:tetratricopeptide repeat protein [Chloroflexi bacterium TSY]
MQHQNQNMDLLSVAIDFQGVEKVRPFVEQANATYPTVIDAENSLGLYFGFKAVPNAVFVDEAGIVRYTKFGGFDIRKAEDRQLADDFISRAEAGSLDAEAKDANGFESQEAFDHFYQGLELYRAGNAQSAIEEWRKAIKLEPDNWIIRKQVWAMENPERFYAGPVDFDWQREQIANGL